MISLPDGRTLDAEALKALRRIAVHAVFELKYSKKQIATILGVRENTVGQWCAAYQEHGVEGLDLQTQGRPSGAGRKLQPTEEQEIQDILQDTTPEENGIPSATWTRAAVAELIRRRYGIELTLPGVGKYLSRWNMTPQKPARHAREQDPEEVEEFFEETLPEVLEKAEQEDGEVHFSDETGAQVNDQIGASYSPCGETPVLTVPKTRIQQNVISSVTADGELLYWAFSGTFNAEKFIHFLEFLIEVSSKKIFLFIDRHPGHTAGAVDRWLADHCSEIEVTWLPRYAPEYNPDEYLNNDLKQNLKHKPMPRNTEAFRQTIGDILAHIAQLPERIKGHFRQAGIDFAT